MITRTQLAVVALLALHRLRFVSYPQIMNLRTSLAVAVFLTAAAFAAYRGPGGYTVPLLQLFGLAGAGRVMLVLHFNAG